MISLPLTHLRIIEPIALLAKLRLFQPLHHQLDVPQGTGMTYQIRLSDQSRFRQQHLMFAPRRVFSR
jgi:hypothetical protein